jgi:hypothetical protein
MQLEKINRKTEMLMSELVLLINLYLQTIRNLNKAQKVCCCNFPTNLRSDLNLEKRY